MATLYDAYGREVDTGLLTEEQAAPTMAGVRNIFSVMHPSAGLTPERLLVILREAEFGDPFLYLELAEEMEEKDLHYLAVLGTRKQSVAQLPLKVRPASMSAEDRRAADLVRDLGLKGPMQLPGALFDILDAIGKGYSATEIIWSAEGRTWVPAQLRWRDPRWFMFDWISGEEILVRTLSGEGPSIPADGERKAAPAHFGGPGMYGAVRGGVGIQPLTAPLAPYKFITHFAKVKSGLPIRGGLARAAGWSYLFKNYVLKDWIRYAELYGQPLRLGKYRAGATERDKSALLRAVARIGVDAAAIVPDSMIIEFVQQQQEGSPDMYRSLAEYLDSQVSKAVLGQTLTTELPDGGGSRAAAQVHNAVRRDILASDAGRLQATLNRDLVRALVDLNLGPRARYPEIEIGLPDESDARTFADIVAELADRGLRVSQSAVLERLDLAPAEAGEAVLRPAREQGGSRAGGV